MAKNKAKTLDTVELGKWLDIRFNYIPWEVFGRLAKLDEEISCYSSVDLQLDASPHQTCCKCDQPVDCCECGSDANLRPSEPSESHTRRRHVTSKTKWESGEVRVNRCKGGRAVANP